jgi:hypothetical protein
MLYWFDKKIIVNLLCVSVHLNWLVETMHQIVSDSVIYIMIQILT